MRGDEGWLHVHVFGGVMSIEHSTRDRDCKIKGLHRYEQCGLHANAKVRLVVTSEGLILE